MKGEESTLEAYNAPFHYAEKKKKEGHALF